MEHPADQSPLGKDSQYVDTYTPSLLFPIARQTGRHSLNIDSEYLPFHGVDIWNAYELSWLNPRGKPVVAVAEFQIPADSTSIIESKSFKLYLNSFNQSAFQSDQQVAHILQRDLSRAVGTQVEIRLAPADRPPSMASLPGQCIDRLDVSIDRYEQPDADLLSCSDEIRQETLHSHLLKSNCPVTGQPDWASIVIDYHGHAIDPASLLRYLVAFRQHQDFHEQCVEKIFIDLQRILQPIQLSVQARYLRRGGLDINPCRYLSPISASNIRTARQ